MNIEEKISDLQEQPPHPILLNVFKHHLGALRELVAHTVSLGPAALPDLARGIAILGGNLMDVYYGPLSVEEVCAKVLQSVEEQGLLDPVSYRAWVDASEEYRTLTFAEDESRWILRMGEEEGRFVHLHPGRWSPQTSRIRANTLKTAVVVAADAALSEEEPLRLKRINFLRTSLLDFAPMKEIPAQGGLREVISLLAL